MPGDYFQHGGGLMKGQATPVELVPIPVCNDPMFCWQHFVLFLIAEHMAPFSAAAGQHFSAILRFHPFAETVLLGALAFLGLIGSFWHKTLALQRIKNLFKYTGKTPIGQWKTTILILVTVYAQMEQLYSFF